MVVYLHAYNLKDRFLQPFTIISDKKNYVSFFQYFISNGLCKVAVPFFFTISGYLFFINLQPKFMGFVRKMGSRIRTLLIPYLLWTILGLIFLYLTQLIPALVDCFDRGIVSSYVTKDYITAILFRPIPFQLWFLNDLIKYVILTPIIYFLVKKLSFVPLIPFIIAWVLELNLCIINNEGILFFMIGALLAVKKIKANRKSNIVLISITAVLWIGLLVYKTILAYDSPVIVWYIQDQVYTIPYIFFMQKLCEILGMFTVWFGYDLLIGELQDSSKLLRFTPYTFSIFAGHEPCMNILYNALLKYLDNSYFTSFIIYIFIPIITISLLILIAMLLKKYLKPVYNVLTGGRGV